MISMLTGIVMGSDENALILDVSGVGFAVNVPERLVGETRMGHELKLYTHMVVREGDISLYGFAIREELSIFRLLIGVSGIGPRTALAAISAYAPETLRTVIASGDAIALARVPGIGKKTAQRLVLDLGDKLGGVGLDMVSSLSGIGNAEVISALTTLGYSLAEARAADEAVPTEVTDLDERILQALRYMGQGL